jgi:hypothetical protein
MSKGAKAMVAACMFPEKGVFRRISYKMLSEARTAIPGRCLQDVAPPSKSNER